MLEPRVPRAEAPAHRLPDLRSVRRPAGHQPGLIR
ncbi:hypothetical protein Ae168Ps1_5024 [Pseudonocardia sp. Ae168_Ps1]|nr:hypothetical protein Ae150APs1_4987 [Pseudonocardia sp. Ae150A_Ps1]OLL82618.1 hypothetical protein Ae168Ps1_5024 [Pseudonocardia sp. Ae168_Ps1]